MMKTVGPQRQKRKLITLDTIPPSEIKWLWYPYIPIGTITALFGRGGAGKTHITCEIAARLSRGEALPDSPDDKVPQNILMLSAEDDYSKVLVPRLLNMGADLSRIAVPDKNFVLDANGIDDMSELMRDFAATVVFIDPIVYYAGGKMDINRSNEVRIMMEKLKTSAEQAECAVIVVGHTRKSQEGSDADSMMGSADWINASRSGLLVTKTNDGTRIVKHAKTNWGMFGKHRAFTIDDNGVHWGETYDDDSLPSKGRAGGPSPRQRDAAIAFLKTILATGPVPAGEVVKLAEDEGISLATLNRAKPGVAESVFSRSMHTMVWRLATDEEKDNQ